MSNTDRNFGLKYCGKCRTEKDITLFSKDTSTKDGLQFQCKDCDKQYRQEHKEHLKDLITRWGKEHPEKLQGYQKKHKKHKKTKPHRKKTREERLEQKRNHYQTTKEKTKAQRKHYRETHKPEQKEWMKKWRVLRKKELKEYQQRYHKEHPEKIYQRTKRYREKNRDKILAWGRQDRKDFPDRYRDFAARRYAKKKNATIAKFSLSNWIKSQMFYPEPKPFKCYLCGKRISKSGMHIEHRVPLDRGGPHAPHNLGISCPTCNFRKHTKTVSEFLPDQFEPDLFETITIQSPEPKEE